MDNIGKASDKITGDVRPDQKTQELLDKLMGTARMLGPAVLSTLPPSARMLQSIAHALVHHKIAPEYEAVFSNVAMLMAVGESIRDQSEQQGRVVPVTPAPSSSALLPCSSNGAPMHFSSDDVLHAMGILTGVAHAEGKSHIAISMCLNIAGRHEHAMVMMEPAGARMIAERLVVSAHMVEDKGSEAVN